MTLHQEMLRLYEDQTLASIDYWGQRPLNAEIKAAVNSARHSYVSDEDLSRIIDEINALRPEIVAAIPSNLRHEYTDLLNDRYGLVAFVYATAEAQESKSVMSSLLNLNFKASFERIVKAKRQQDSNPAFLKPDSEVELTPAKLDKNLKEYRGRLAGTDLGFIYQSLSGFLIEGYSILALETTQPLSEVLDDHYNQLFNRSLLTHYFEHYPRYSRLPSNR